VLTRLYSPEDLGVLAAFTALVTTAAMIVTLRYELAIPLPEDARRSIHLLNLVLLCALGGSCLIASIILLYPNLFFFYIDTKKMEWIFWVFPISVLFTAINQGLYFYALRFRFLKGIALSKLAQSVVVIVIQIGGFFLIESALIAGFVIGQIIQAVLLAHWIRLPSLIHLPCADTRACAVHYRRFPLFYLWSSLISGVNMQIPFFLITYYFGINTAGYYAIAYRIVNSLSSLVGQSIGHAYLSVATRERERLPELTQRLYTRQVELIMPLALLYGILGPELGLILLGNKWQETGIIIQWLVPLVCLTFVINPLTEIFTLYEKQFFSMLFQTLLLIQRVFSIGLVATLSGDKYHAIACFSISGSLMWCGLLFLLMHVCRLPVWTVFLPCKRIGWWISMVIVMMFFKYLKIKILSIILFVVILLLIAFYLLNIMEFTQYKHPTR
jgi:O-antigen/teichoic acid export membrane protein